MIWSLFGAQFGEEFGEVLQCKNTVFRQWPSDGITASGNLVVDRTDQSDVELAELIRCFRWVSGSADDPCRDSKSEKG